jgi:hypothetical protein
MVIRVGIGIRASNASGGGCRGERLVDVVDGYGWGDGGGGVMA